ncbi:DNA methyltransferase [Deinococcus sp. YIM 134068]|uniref:DNA methyltransferase n=1 Tax=Deinococcus lichenicola TaxID=3118910 RepID=UPI002F95041E
MTADPGPLKTSRLFPAVSTVGRGKSATLPQALDVTRWEEGPTSLVLGDSLDYYRAWGRPNVIVSDGAYGVLGFEGDTSDHLGIAEWYEPHVQAWTRAASPETTLWFWNSEVGWATAHPVLERYGWRYVNCNIWNKGKGHIAGNVNTAKIRRFPVVTEVCVQYVFEARIDGLLLKHWLLREWRRSGLPLAKANEACGVANVATRKYLDQGHLWYFPPPEMFARLAAYANIQGRPEGAPYFSADGRRPLTAEEWSRMRAPFTCPHGFTNVWERGPLHGSERVKAANGRAAHLNQKPLDLMTLLLKASLREGGVVWEPFGGLFTASLAAHRLGQKSFAAEIDPAYFYYGLKRFTSEARAHPRL